MKRREFLRRTIPAGTIPLLIHGLPITVYGRSPILDNLPALADETDRVLVLVQMSGGNDGLNTVIPLDQYSALTAARSNIMIPVEKVLALRTETGLHPAMTGMYSLYNQGSLAVVQSVSYPSPNLSHFRATDIWLTASDSNQYLNSGWLGRYLEDVYTGYPTGYPTTAMPDPPAIQIGSLVTPALQGDSVSVGVAVSDPNSSYMLPGGSDVAPNTPAGHELTFIRQVAEQTQKYTEVIRTASSKVANKSTLYPAATAGNTLANSMKIIARLIAGGLKTRVYVVSATGSFDTHSAQVVSGATETGTHATLLGRLSDAITAFVDDLQLLGAQNRVIGMTFSEFGRRIKSNASLGTDHGVAAPLFVFGAQVNGGVIGLNPVLPAAATVNENIAMQYDFRMVYASILRQWFGASESEVESVLPGQSTTLPLIKPGAVLAVDDEVAVPHEFRLEQNFPNPFNPGTDIRFQISDFGRVLLRVYDMLGREVMTLVDEYRNPGTYSVHLDATHLSSGVYLYTLSVSPGGRDRTSGAKTLTKKMTLLK
jgi:uncharacterized protein (DUF1501 family)